MSRALPILILLVAIACSAPLVDPAGIDGSAIEAHMRLLSSDEMGGRAAATPGHQAAAEYVAAEFEKLGLEPAGQGASWYQPVPLMAAHLLADETSLVLERGVERVELEIDRDVVVDPDFLRQGAELSAPLVYAGFGVRAAELGHDDYAGLDVKGKVVVLLGGAPAGLPYAERVHHASVELKARTAAEHGALGLLLMRLPADRENETWDRVVQHSRMPAMRWVADGGKPFGAFEELFVTAVLSVEGERKLLDGESRTPAELFDEAASGATEAFDLAARLQLRTTSRHERMRSPNVIARLPGSDASLAGEHVVLTAHLDHVGSIPVEAGGDGIFNGAYDNASGVAVMLEVARAMTTNGAPRRSVLFIATTAEEQGLLGSDYFAARPTVDVDSLVAAINFDTLLMQHPLKDVIAFGAGSSELGKAVERVAANLGLGVVEEPTQRPGAFTHGDHHSFIRRGVPSILLTGGVRNEEGDGAERLRDWMLRTWHTPADDMNQPIDFEAGAEFARFGLAVVTEVADDGRRPGN